MDSLAEIFNRWGTDKAVNGFSELYECLFLKRRYLITSVLEIGIGTMIPGVHSSMVGFAGDGYRPGGSLRAWREFFPNAEIFGIDVQPDTQLNEDRIVTRQCDSTDRAQVAEFSRSVWQRSFDVIIDDGSHLVEDQLSTLANFFDLLERGGTYVIEDIAVGGMSDQQDAIRSICGVSPFFFVGAQCNPLVIVKR